LCSPTTAAVTMSAQNQRGLHGLHTFHERQRTQPIETEAQPDVEPTSGGRCVWQNHEMVWWHVELLQGSDKMILNGLFGNADPPDSIDESKAIIGGPDNRPLNTDKPPTCERWRCEMQVSNPGTLEKSSVIGRAVIPKDGSDAKSCGSRHSGEPMLFLERIEDIHHLLEAPLWFNTVWISRFERPDWHSTEHSCGVFDNPVRVTYADLRNLLGWHGQWITGEEKGRRERVQEILLKHHRHNGRRHEGVRLEAADIVPTIQNEVNRSRRLEHRFGEFEGL
jgi:hypothetical protein